MAVRIVRICSKASYHASFVAHGKIDVAECDCQHAAVHAIARSLVVVVEVYGIKLADGHTASVVADVVVNKVEKVLDVLQFVVLARDGVELEIFAHTLKVGMLFG